MAQLMKLADFCQLSDDAMMALIQSDASDAEELDIFNGLLRWGRRRFGQGVSAKIMSIAIHFA